MDHVVYLDTRAGELEKLLSGRKTMILRGAAGRKLPHGRVEVGDSLFFMRNNAEGLVTACGEVNSVLNSEKLTPEESTAMVNGNQDRLQLTQQQVDRWAGKRYLVLIGVADVRLVEPFAVDRSQFGSMDDWLPVGAIEAVKLSTH